MHRLRKLMLRVILGFLAVLLLGYGIPLAAIAPLSSAQEPTESFLETEEASQPDNTLPLPNDASPNGVLKLPSRDDSHESLGEVPETGESDHNRPDSEVETPEDWAILFKGLSPQQIQRARLLMAADRLYLAGDRAASESLYQQAKETDTPVEPDGPAVKVEPVTDIAELPPAAAVYWREAQAGAAAGLETRMLVPLKLLVEEYPEFLPGQALYVDYLLQHDQIETAVTAAEAAVSQYPFHPILLKVYTEALMAQEKWLEAAIAARQFTLFHPDHSEAESMLILARDNVDRFRRSMNEELTGNLFSNIITGAAGYILTGGLFGPFTAINSSVILLQGENAIGEQVANQALSQLPIMHDDEVNQYVDTIGHRLAALTGRHEFNYEFHVVMDETLNAFALPGGKIFINAGALTKAKSEAELAGLIGHEISHAALSHGFQMATQGNLTNSIAAFIPIPEVANIAASLVVSGYSRDMERQADVLGTQILSAGDYAADGLYHLMVTLRDEADLSPNLNWFASHPATDERVSYLNELVNEGGFNRYAYEGVENHLKIRHRVGKLLAEYQSEQGGRYSGGPD